MNRNESAERFPPAFNIPLRSSPVCRYHSSSRTPICSKTRLKRLARQRQNTHKLVRCSAGAAKVENASTSQVCRQPCEDLAGVLTEIEGLRFVTGNLLEDLDRVVRQIRTKPFRLSFDCCAHVCAWLHANDFVTEACETWNKCSSNSN